MKKKDTVGRKVERKCYGIRLSQELVKRAKYLALKWEMPVNRILEQALSEFLSRQKE